MFSQFSLIVESCSGDYVHGGGSTHLLVNSGHSTLSPSLGLSPFVQSLFARPRLPSFRRLSARNEFKLGNALDRVGVIILGFILFLSLWCFLGGGFSGRFVLVMLLGFSFVYSLVMVPLDGRGRPFFRGGQTVMGGAPAPLAVA